MIAPAAEIATIVQRRAFVSWRLVSPDTPTRGTHAASPRADERTAAPRPTRTTATGWRGYISPAYEPKRLVVPGPEVDANGEGSYIGALNLTHRPASDLPNVR